MEVGRRAFLQGRVPPKAASPLRPPWAIAETAFLAQCSRCADCIAACPTGLLVKGAGNFPEANFGTAYCDFCGACRKACQSGALDRNSRSRPWHLQVRIGNACLAQHGSECRSCGEHCEVGALRFTPRRGGPALPQLDSTRCNGCGACIAACPSQAMAMIGPSAPHSAGALT